MKKAGGKLAMVVLVALLLGVALPPLSLAAATVPEDIGTTEIATDVAAAQVVLSSYDLKKIDESDNTAYILYITLTNQGSADAHNVLVTYTDPNDIFLPAYGTSNQLHIASIAAGTSVSSEIRLVSQGEVETFILTFTLQYRNPQSLVGNSFYIGSFTGRPTDAVQLTQIEITGNADAEGKIPVRVVITNLSGEALSDLQMNVYSVVTGTTQTMALGVLETEETLDKIYALTLSELRVQQVRVSLTYHDAEGIGYTTNEQVYNLYGYQQTDAGVTGSVTSLFEEMQSYMPQIVLHLVLMAVVLILLLVIWARRRRRAPSNTKGSRKNR